jgi:thiol-disulfide isomerase/thioredoxin
MRFLNQAAAGAILLAVAARGQDPDPMKIIAKVDETTKAVTAVTYKITAYGIGVMEKEVPRLSATVYLKQLEQKDENSLPMLRIETKTDDKDQTLISDGKEVLLLNNKDKKAKRGKARDFSSELATARRMFYFTEYMHPRPFSDELNGKARKHEGMKTIGDTECHVIYVDYSAEQNVQARWYFGAKDNLPHRVDRIQKRGDAEGAFVTELTQVDPNPKIDDKTFSLTAPEGYEDDSPGLLQAGKPAPAWSLKTPDGKSVSLADLKGKVVLMDFWATWCGPCKKAMPGIQKLHEKYKDKDVVVLGVNCWEKGGDPATYMKEQNFTYGLLLGGDDVATQYRVKSIPSFFVIGRDGKIAFSQAGIDEKTETALPAAIDAALAAK